MKNNYCLLIAFLCITILVSLSSCSLPVKQPAALNPTITKTTLATKQDGIRIESLTPTSNKAAVEQPTQTFSPVPQSTVTETPGSTTTSIAPIPTISTKTVAPTNTPAPTSTKLATSANPVAASSPTPTPQLLPPANLPLPATYILQRGEFPFCIARRYNIDQYELMWVNGLNFYFQFFYPGLVLELPQTGHPFIGIRALNYHTPIYTVSSWNESVRSVACFFGDIDPQTIADINHLDVNATLYFGQVLQLTK